MQNNQHPHLVSEVKKVFFRDRKTKVFLLHSFVLSHHKQAGAVQIQKMKSQMVLSFRVMLINRFTATKYNFLLNSHMPACRSVVMQNQ